MIADTVQQHRIVRAAAHDAGAHPSALIAAALFAASAAFVVLRNSEIGVLVDISYIVNTATRIALGDVPYAQFPLAQAPGEFLVQALLIKLFGAHYAVQIAYAAIVGGIATALTYAITSRLLNGTVPASRMVAAILAIALVPVGVYAIYPAPFYDCDACVLILAALAAVLSALDHGGFRRSAFAGTLLALPIFMKQNVGGAFLALMLIALALHAWRSPNSRKAAIYITASTGIALAIEIVVLQLVIGIDNYVRWAWTFALAGRGVTLDRLTDFGIPALVTVLLTVLLFRAPIERLVLITGIALGALLIIQMNRPAPLINATAFFPPVMFAAAAFGVARMRRDGPTVALALPLVIIGTTLGVLQSQALRGSSFGIFPFVVLALATAGRDAAALVPARAVLVSRVVVALALALAVSGSIYTLSNARLAFIDVNAPGPVVRSSFPSLAGLSARGPYVEDLDQILVWARDHVGPDEGFVFLPGEDPAFFALGRKPALPSVYFYDVATPYTPSEIAAIADQRGLRWVFVKDRLQLSQTPPLQEPLVEALTTHATLVERIGAYRVYRR